MIWWITSAHGQCDGCIQSLCHLRTVTTYAFARAYANTYTQAWECLTAERPWSEFTDIFQIITAVLVSNDRPALPSAVPAEMASLPALIQECWQVGPTAYGQHRFGLQGMPYWPITCSI